MAKSNTKKKSKKKTTSYNKKKKKTTISNNKKKNSKAVNNKSKTVKNNKNNKKIKNINESNKKFTQIDSKINNSKKIIEKETNDINTAEPQVIKESTENITELKNQTLPKNTEKKQEIIKDIKNNNKLKDLIAKIKNKVKKISKQNNKSLDDEISDEKITINKKMLTIVTMILIVITIIYIPLMLILRDKKDTTSFKKISIDKYIELYDKKEMNYVFVTTNKCTYCDLLRTKLSKLQNEYKIEILELNVGNLSEKDKEKLNNSNSVFNSNWQAPMLLSISSGKEVNGISGYKEYSALKKFIDNSNSSSEINSFVKINLNKYLSLIKSNEKIVIYIGRTGNNACDNYSKVLDEVAKDKNIKPYYLNTDLINTEEEWEKFDNSNKIFNEEWFTPTTLIVEKGNIIDYKMESMDKGTLISFLSENGI